MIVDITKGNINVVQLMINNIIGDQYKQVWHNVSLCQYIRC